MGERSGETVHVNELSFPVLAFCQGELSVFRATEELSNCTRYALKNGFFDGLEIIDSDGRRFLVEDATKVRGVGPFGGWNIFLNQRIEVRVTLRSLPEQADVAELRRRILSDFARGTGWHSRDDYQSLRARVRAAQSVGEAIAALT